MERHGQVHHIFIILRVDMSSSMWPEILFVLSNQASGDPVCVWWVHTCMCTVPAVLQRQATEVLTYPEDSAKNGVRMERAPRMPAS